MIPKTSRATKARKINPFQSQKD